MSKFLQLEYTIIQMFVVGEAIILIDAFGIPSTRISLQYSKNDITNWFIRYSSIDLV